MPTRATKRGEERTPFAADPRPDVLVCGASFAGLAVARELAGSGAKVLVLDRYEIGERQTSACAAPTEWLHALDLGASIKQTFGRIVMHTRSSTYRWSLPWEFSTFDYRLLCDLLWAQAGEDATFDTAKVEGRTGHTVHTDRGDVSAPLVVDALGWRRILSSTEFTPPRAPLSRGLEVHPAGEGDDLELWLDRHYVPAGYGWSFPADDEVRVGVGSFDPAFNVKPTTLELVRDVRREPDGWQGNYIPHKLRPATEDGIFFVGDSAGHCLPVTAEGIRTALYFGLAAGRELRAVVSGEQDRSTALRRYHEFSDAHEWQFSWLLRAQKLVPRVHPHLLEHFLKRYSVDKHVGWSFGHYLDIAHPRFVTEGAPGARAPAVRPAAEAGSHTLVPA